MKSRLYYYYNINQEEYYCSHLDNAILLSNSFLKDDIAQPIELSILASRMVNDSSRTIFDPFAGMMTGLTRFTKAEKIVGYEIDPLICDLAQIRNAILLLDDRMNIICQSAADWTNEYFDSIVTTPPTSRLNIPMVYNNKRYTDYSEFVLDLFDETTTENGDMFLVAPARILYSVSAKNLRKKIVSQNHIDAVINLPVLYKWDVVILYLNKCRKKNAPIRILNAVDCVVDRKKILMDVDSVLRNLDKGSKDCLLKLTADDIKQHGYSLLFKDYQQSHLLANKYPQVALGALLEVIDDNAPTNVSLPYVSTDCLSFEPFSPALSLSKLSIKEGNTCHVIKKRALLINKINPKQTGICEASVDKPVYVDRNILAVAVYDEMAVYANLDYIRLAIDKIDFSISSTVDYLRLNAFLNTKIGLPDSLEVQGQIYSKARQQWMSEVVEEKGLDEYFNSDNRQIAIESALVHSQNVSAIADGMSVLLQKDGTPTEKLKEKLESLQHELKKLQGEVNKLRNSKKLR